MVATAALWVCILIRGPQDTIERTPVTAIRFSGGEVIEVNLSLADVRKLLQKALATGVLMEFESADGDMVVINPQQVQYLQNGSTEPFPGVSAASDALTASST
jgi:hypothetical protein